MPDRCVAGGCGNVADKARGIKVHRFPSDAKLADKWLRFVQLRRKDFAIARTSVLCSEHFTSDSYTTSTHLISDKSCECGYREERILQKKNDAVPTISCKRKASDRGDSLYRKNKERRELVNEAILELKDHCPDSSHMLEPVPDASDINPVPSSSASNIWRSRRSRNLVKSIVGIVDIPPAEVRNSSCQVQFRQRRPPHRSVKTECTLVSHQFVHLPADVTIGSSNFEESVKSASASTSTDCPAPSSASTPKKEKSFEEESFDVSVGSFLDNEVDDPTWSANMSFDEVNEPDEPESVENSGRVKLYAVTESRLLNLFRVCQSCGSKAAEGKVASVNGTLVTISQFCLSCDQSTKWSSQELIGSYASGNISLSTALLCSGNVPSKALRMLELWGVQSIKPQAFCAHQRKFINQAVRNVWEEEVIRAMSNLDERVQLSGDGRCDSMGHCAKYGSYTLHDKQTNSIICTQLVVSTEPETQKSAAMEVLGLKRALDVVEAYCPHLEIVLVTDGHPGVAKHVREERELTHYLDIWHVAKGLKKRMAKMEKKCPEIIKWKRSIINHLYWCAVSSNNDSPLMVAKWKSLANHLINVHDHDDELYPRCLHGRLGRKLWFDPASEAYDTVCRRVILNRDVLKYVAKLSSDAQTSGLEGFHSTVNQFAPKMYHFGYQGMQSRVELAALHFNENNKRTQKTGRDGNPSFNIRFPKSRGGQYVVVPVMSKPTYEYADRVRKEVIRLVRSGETYRLTSDAPLLCSMYERPESKEMAVAEHKAYARFK